MKQYLAKATGSPPIIVTAVLVICMQLCGWCNVVKITTEMLGARSGVQILQELVLPERREVGYCEKGYVGLC